MIYLDNAATTFPKPRRVIESVRDAMLSADGAFSSETDPSPNNPVPFGQTFAGTGKILNLRAVGNADTVADTVRKVWQPGLKLIVNTYCKTPEEQQEAYDRIQEICR